MKILKFPHPALFTQCAEVTEFGPELKANLDAMWDLMIAHGGVGLAANQVSLFDRFFVMKGPAGQRIYLVNPEIWGVGAESNLLPEGCLSAPGEFVTLERPEKVYINYQDENGKKFTISLTGYYAVCAIHELDHLDGKSFLESESLDKKTRKRLAKKWGIT